MAYAIYTLLFGVLVGLVGVASNPSPYFAALGLVLVAGMGCGVLVECGGSFLSLILFLIYLGGMLVVFAYSAALAAEPFPESWGSLWVFCSVLVYLLLLLAGVAFFGGGWFETSWVSVHELSDFEGGLADASGVGLMYSFGGGFLMLAVGGLLLALFAVLELTRGLSRGTIRAV